MDNSWFYTMLLNIRDEIAADADIIAMVATVIAGFVIVVKMIGFHYKLSSDEQGSGFGENVRAWDFLKPIVLLLALNFSPQMAQMLNDVVEECMSALDEGAEAKHFKAMYIAELTTKKSSIEENYPEILAHSEEVMALAEANNEKVGWYSSEITYKKESDDAIAHAFALSVIADHEKTEKELDKTRHAPAKEVMEKHKDGRPSTDASSMLGKAAKDTVEDVELSLSTLIDALYKWIWDMFIDVLMWIYNMIILIRLFMGTVAMSVMLYFFPLVFLAMLFDRYKGAFGSVLVVYVELALWRPIASLLQHISTAAITEVSGGSTGQLFVLMVLIATIMAANEVGMYAKYALTAFNGSGGNASGKSGMGQIKNMIK